MKTLPDIQRILVPHDFSECAEHALSYALSLARKFSARVTVVHSYELPTLGYSEAIVASIEMASAIEQAATKALAEVAVRAHQPKVDIETLVRRGNPSAEIVAVAKETNADLIVMGTHGRKGVPRVLFGSVAEKVVRTAPCPVLTVHLAPAASQAVGP